MSQSEAPHVEMDQNQFANSLTSLAPENVRSEGNKYLDEHTETSVDALETYLTSIFDDALKSKNVPLLARVYAFADGSAALQITEDLKGQFLRQITDDIADEFSNELVQYMRASRE